MANLRTFQETDRSPSLTLLTSLWSDPQEMPDSKGGHLSSVEREVKTSRSPEAPSKNDWKEYSSN